MIDFPDPILAAPAAPIGTIKKASTMGTKLGIPLILVCGRLFEVDQGICTTLASTLI